MRKLRCNESKVPNVGAGASWLYSQLWINADDNVEEVVQQHKHRHHPRPHGHKRRIIERLKHDAEVQRASGGGAVAHLETSASTPPRLQTAPTALHRLALVYVFSIRVIESSVALTSSSTRETLLSVVQRDSCFKSSNRVSVRFREQDEGAAEKLAKTKRGPELTKSKGTKQPASPRGYMSREAPHQRV